jgi:hypothetical protein
VFLFSKSKEIGEGEVRGGGCFVRVSGEARGGKIFYLYYSIVF